MKKQPLKFLIAFAALALVFTSCEEDLTDPIPPTIKFFAGTDLITEDVTVTTGETIGFSWQVTAGDANLETFSLRLGSDDIDGFSDLEIDKDEYEDTFDTVFYTAGDYVFTFIAEDKDGETTTEKITVTVESASSPIETYTITLGSYDASTGSSFASIDGSVLSWSDATSNSSKIDFVYFYGSSNGATVAAPDDSDVDAVFDLSSWATKNGTTFSSTSVTATEFDEMTDDAVISTVSGTDSKANQLSVGDVFAFVTASTSDNPDKNGLVKVVSIDGTTGSGTIDLVVKVQE